MAKVKKTIEKVTKKIKATIKNKKFVYIIC